MCEDVFVQSNKNHLNCRRSLKILAESYAIKGLCLVNKGLKGSSKFKQAERETEMVKCDFCCYNFIHIFLTILDNML